MANNTRRVMGDNGLKKTGMPKGSKHGIKKKGKTPDGLRKGNIHAKGQKPKWSQKYLRDAIETQFTPGPFGTAYQPHYVEQAKLALMAGFTDLDLARLLRVSQMTLLNWRKKYPEFDEAVREGRKQADIKVANALFAAATGAKIEAVKIFYDSKLGETVEHKYIEHHTPNVQSAIFWLTNRDPENWKQTSRLEQSGPDGGPIETSMKYEFSQDTLQAALAKLGITNDFPETIEGSTKEGLKDAEPKKDK